MKISVSRDLDHHFGLFCRYHFNGKETDSEWTGNGGDSYDFGARMYDGRLGRWLSIDPKSRSYSDISVYSFVANCPLIFTDVSGRDITPNVQTNYTTNNVVPVRAGQLGNTGIVNYSIKYNSSTGAYDIVVNININMNSYFAEAGDTEYSSGSELEKENPGLHKEVLAHEQGHADAYFEYAKKDITLTDVNGQVHTGRPDQVMSDVILVYQIKRGEDRLAILNEKSATIDKILNDPNLSPEQKSAQVAAKEQEYTDKLNSFDAETAGGTLAIQKQAVNAINANISKYTGWDGKETDANKRSYKKLGGEDKSKYNTGKKKIFFRKKELK